MTTTELLAAIDRIRDELAEVRRYVRQPRHLDLHPTITAMLLLPVTMGELVTLHRLAANLGVGVVAIRVAPTVLESYLDAASWELAAMRGRIEREADRDKQANGEHHD